LIVPSVVDRVPASADLPDAACASGSRRTCRSSSLPAARRSQAPRTDPSGIDFADAGRQEDEGDQKQHEHDEHDTTAPVVRNAAMSMNAVKIVQVHR
jgi:hypothetical protein